MSQVNEQKMYRRAASNGGLFRNAMLGAVLCGLLASIPTTYAGSKDLAPMLGTWQCRAEGQMRASGKEQGSKPIKLVETYTGTTTADGMSEADDTTVYYLPVNDKLMPIEVVTHSSARYRLEGGTLYLLATSYELREGRIHGPERAAFVASIAGKDTPASARSQMGAKLDRMAEDFAEMVVKNYQGMVAKKKEIPIPFRLSMPAPGKLEKTFGNGENASVHRCVRPGGG